MIIILKGKHLIGLYTCKARARKIRCIECPHAEKLHMEEAYKARSVPPPFVR